MGVNRDGETLTVVASTDGVEWAAVGPAAPAATAPFQVADAAAGTILVAAGVPDGRVRAWLLPPAGSAWQPVMAGPSSVRPDDIDVDGDAVVVGGDALEPGRRPWNQSWVAVSADGGRTWRETVLADSDGRGACTTRVAAGPEALVSVLGDCTRAPTLARSARIDTVP